MCVHVSVLKIYRGNFIHCTFMITLMFMMEIHRRHPNKDNLKKFGIKLNFKYISNELPSCCCVYNACAQCILLAIERESVFYIDLYAGR